jgi:hypothetical protein
MAFVAATLVLISYPAALLCVVAGDLHAALIFNALFNVMLPGYLAGMHGAVLGVADARIRGFVVATLGIVLNLIGYGGGPQVVGLISDWLAKRGAKLPLRQAMEVLLSAAVWAAVHFYWAAYRLRRSDLRAPPSERE